MSCGPLDRRMFLGSVAGASLITLPPLTTSTGRTREAQAAANSTPPRDPRNIETGLPIPSEGYCDQPYVVKTKDHAWLCVMTTGKGREGQPGQHIIATRSTDRGRTWSKPVDIEPAAGPEASWAMPWVTPFGRIYVFYTYNAQNLREVIADKGNVLHGGTTRRVDTLGEFALKYSDDGGQTWTPERWLIPVRQFAIDRRNPYRGQVRFFWGVGKPMSDGKSMWLGFSKVGRFGEGFLAESQACFLRSDNISTERDPNRINWVTLPEGEHGLISPQGPIAEESNLTILSDGTLFCTYRTVAGHPCHAYSRDRGATWTPPAYMTTGPGLEGERINHPRAANFVRKLDQGRHAGKFIYWFHNHRGRTYEHRNPAWLLGGVERDSPGGKVLQWGRPEVVLYDPVPTARISYPDFIEEGEDLYISATQKSIARIHAVERRTIDRLFDAQT
jgi:hypothetical protein